MVLLEELIYIALHLPRVIELNLDVGGFLVQDLSSSSLGVLVEVGVEVLRECGVRGGHSRLGGRHRHEERVTALVKVCLRGLRGGRQLLLGRGGVWVRVREGVLLLRGSVSA